MLLRLFRPFLMWFFRAVESKGFNNSKEQRSSPETDMIAPQLSNSPQYYDKLVELRGSASGLELDLTLGAEKTVTRIRSW